MANRGLTNQEIALVKGMLALKLRRDVIISFFMHPGRLLSPAFVGEIAQGTIGSTVAEATREQVEEYIESRLPGGDTTSVNQPDFFDIFPPKRIYSTVRFAFDEEGRLVAIRYPADSFQGGPQAPFFFEDARREIAQLLSDTGLSNHPRLTRRLAHIHEHLERGFEYLVPMFAGVEASKLTGAIPTISLEISAELASEIQSAAFALLQLARQYREWLDFELKASALDVEVQAEVDELAEEIHEYLAKLAGKHLDPAVPLAIADYFPGAYVLVDGQTELPTKINKERGFTLNANLNQLFSFISKGAREAGRSSGEYGKEILKAIRDGSIWSVERVTRFLFCAGILVALSPALMGLAKAAPTAFGWLSSLQDFLANLGLVM
jgi:hypothetical protein